MDMRKGYLTVFLALTLTIMISLCLTAIEGVRRNTMRMEIECVSDIAYNSVLAEYHRELLEQYDLLFIDTSYGTAVPDYKNTAEHFHNYMNYNFGSDRWLMPLAGVDFLKLESGQVRILEASVATDDDGMVLRRQAANHILDKLGVGIVKDVQNWLQEVSGYDYLTDRTEEARDKSVKELNDWESLESTVIEDPGAIIADYRNNKLLSTVTSGNLSHQTIHKELYVSSRNCNRGTGMNPDREYRESFVEQILFHEYIVQKTGHYGSEKEKGVLRYQTEYILEGKESDLENLKNIIYKLLVFREAANTAHLYGDAGKKGLAEAAATIIASACMVPQAAPVLEVLLILAWACAESIYDVKSLLAGGRVPVMKKAEEWHYGLDNILDFGAIKSEVSEGSGMSYEDFLRVFLCFQDVRTNTFRLMDIMEMDIRQTKGNSHFRMDGCIDSFLAEATVKSGYGPQYTIKRRYGY